MAGDTYLKSGSPNQNQDTELFLRVRSSGTNRALLQVGAAAIQAAVGDGSLVSARLELQITNNGDNWGSGGWLDAHRLQQSWSAPSATWNCSDDAELNNSAPDCSGTNAWDMGAPSGLWAELPSSSELMVNGLVGTVKLNVTADVHDILSGGADFGWVLKKRNEGAAGLVEFGSSESSAAPKLVLIVKDGAVFEVCDNDLDDDGDGEVDCADPDCSSEAICGLLTNAAVLDTYVKSGSANQNQGDEPALRVRQDGKNRALLAFEPTAINNALAGGALLSATLELSIIDNGNNWGSAGRTLDLHRLTQAWTENGATWNCAIDSNPANSSADCSGPTDWQMGGAGPNPWDAAPTSTILIANQQVGRVTFDVTADLQKFLDESSPNYGQNYGWLLKKTEEGQSGHIEFGSKESTSPPRLILELEGGETGPPLPPDPSLVAPPIDRTVATTVFSATEFLFGITDDERAILGARYAPGQRLWRAALEHFSIYDYNFRIEIPTDDAFPPERIVSDEAPVDICPGSGSIIKKQPQSLEEAVDLGPSGTGLHYSCERTKGRRDAFSRTIHVTGPTFSPSMRSPRVRAVVAGQVLEASFSVAPNVDFDLEWDGKDAYGRTPQGPQRATVEVIYRYPTKVAWGAEYGSLVRSFGRWTPFYGLLSARPVWNLDVGTKREIELGTWDESVQKLGGWSLDDHHSLSMATGTVFFGDGRKQNDASSVANLLARRVAAPTTSPSPRTGACSSAPLATTACERSIPPSCSTKSSATAASTMLTKTAPLPTSAASTWMTRAASMSPKTTRFGEPLPMETWRWWRRAPTVSSVTIPVQPWTRG